MIEDTMIQKNWNEMTTQERIQHQNRQLDWEMLTDSERKVEIQRALLLFRAREYDNEFRQWLQNKTLGTQHRRIAESHNGHEFGL